MAQAGQNESGGPQPEPLPAQVGSSYAQFQLAKAFAATARATDAQEHGHASAKVASWRRVIQNLMTGSVDYGVRTPVNQAPAWATLEVLTGGFATGALLASGPLLPHELATLQRIGPVRPGEERAQLNAYFLSDAGLAELQDWLRTRQYAITVPEEGALLVAAWLVGDGHADQARALLGEISPFFHQLRFYPSPSTRAVEPRSVVYVKDAPTAVKQLNAMGPHPGVLAQQEAVRVWAPFRDRMLALILETVRDDWPCQTYPPDWAERGRGLLNEFTQLRKTHQQCRNPENLGKHFAQLRQLLAQTVSAPQSLTGRDVARIRAILKGYVAKRGAPGSELLTRYRDAQASDVSAPTHDRFAQLVAARACAFPEGLSADDIAQMLSPATSEEALRHGLSIGLLVPASIRRKIEGCLADTPEELTRQGHITSGEVLAKVLVQITSGIRAQAVDDPLLQPVYASVYSAFRMRRSLLLLNLQKQVQIEELPWVAAIDAFRTQGVQEQDVSRQALTHVSAMALAAFPHAILPNKLLQELKALAKGADLKIPLVDELAADIFMGQFSTTFVDAVLQTAQVMQGSLYATYYGIDYQIIAQELSALRGSDAKTQAAATQLFADICGTRAGTVRRSTPAANGMVIEQQQILTTQNLSVLFSALGLRSVLDAQLISMAQQCFRWVCRRQQLKMDDFHARLIMLKNTAYAWRQMIFFLSLQPDRVPEFLQWAAAHLQQQPEAFRARFEAAISGLDLASLGQVPPDEPTGRSRARRFLGWSTQRHWLMPAKEVFTDSLDTETLQNI